LFYLSLVAVVGGGKAQLHVVLKIGSHAQLGILFLTPDVCRALGYSYLVMLST
jgi:hypothetical protein